MAMSLDSLVEKHSELIAKAISAVETRESWSPFTDSPSRKFHGDEKPAAGRKAFEAHLGKPFRLDQPGEIGRVGSELSPYTQEALGIDYPKADPAAIVAAAEEAMAGWRCVSPTQRIALCLEMAERLYDRNFEMAYAIMHVAGQSFTQAFSGSGPNALDRGIEALAYAAKAMKEVAPTAQWRRRFGGEEVLLEKEFRLMPRGLGLVICCASFPTWNAYPAMFASLATGNPVIVKPHPAAILPMAIAVEICRQTLSDFGCDANCVTLAVDTVEEPVAQRYIDHPSVQIIDFTGSPRYGGYLERTVTGKLLFTETAGLNSVVIDSTGDLAATARAVARATCLFSAQMCTSPQNIYIPQNVRVGDVEQGFDEIAAAIVEAIDEIAGNPASAAGIMGAIQTPNSVTIVEDIAMRAANDPECSILRPAAPYAHPEFPSARTLTPLVVATDQKAKELYTEEQFGPVLFLIKTKDREVAVSEATQFARRYGAISSYLYSFDEAFIERAVDAYAAAGANLSVNLHGAMWINFAAAYSDYHVTGLNPAGNACLADLAFVASRFRIVQSRRPVGAKDRHDAA